MVLFDINKVISQSRDFLRGKEDKVKLTLCNILAKGHTLIEDSPGVGKTTLVKYLGKSIGLNISRIQFTNDLLPSDIIGTSIFHKESSQFVFHKGPLFGELILADELNRAPPKTQSALLQAMEEREITIDGNTIKLPPFFTVIATQNPHMQVGTFDLPESQLDRFSMKIKMGYADEKSTIELLKYNTDQILLNNVKTILSTDKISEAQEVIQTVKIEDDILTLIFKLLDISRTNKDVIPLSNRCGIDLVNISKAWAYLEKRMYVIPDDIYHIFPFVAGHRLVHPESSDIELEHKVAHKILKLI